MLRTFVLLLVLQAATISHGINLKPAKAAVVGAFAAWNGGNPNMANSQDGQGGDGKGGKGSGGGGGGGKGGRRPGSGWGDRRSREGPSSQKSPLAPIQSPDRLPRLAANVPVKSFRPGFNDISLSFDPRTAFDDIVPSVFFSQGQEPSGSLDGDSQSFLDGWGDRFQKGADYLSLDIFKKELPDHLPATRYISYGEGEDQVIVPEFLNDLATWEDIDTSFELCQQASSNWIGPDLAKGYRRLYSANLNGMQLVIGRRNNKVFVAIGDIDIGSESELFLKDRIKPVKFRRSDGKESDAVHIGLQVSLLHDSIRSTLNSQLETLMSDDSITEIAFTGHGIAGSVASASLVDIFLTRSPKLERLFKEMKVRMYALAEYQATDLTPAAAHALTSDVHDFIKIRLLFEGDPMVALRAIDGQPGPPWGAPFMAVTRTKEKATNTESSSPQRNNRKAKKAREARSNKIRPSSQWEDKQVIVIPVPHLQPLVMPGYDASRHALERAYWVYNAVYKTMLGLEVVWPTGDTDKTPRDADGFLD